MSRPRAYIVEVPVISGGKTIRRVNARVYDLTIPGWESFNFIVHRPISVGGQSARSSSWDVSERTTLAAIGVSAPTIEKAREAAKEKLDEVGEEKVLMAITKYLFKV
jgi:hypothetical protein